MSATVSSPVTGEGLVERLGAVGPIGWLSFAAVLVYVASIPLEDLGHLGPVGSLAKVAGVLLIAASVFAFLGGNLRILRADRSIFIFGAFVTWAALSYFWSSNTDQTLVRVSTYVQLFAVTLAIWQQLGSTARIRLVLQAFVVGAFLGSLYAILFANPSDTAVARFSVGDPNSFGVQVVFAMVVAYYLLRTSALPRLKWFYALFLVIGAVEVFYTASRTAVAVLGVAAAITVIDRRNLRPRVLAALVALVTVAGFGVARLVSSAQLGRLSTIGQATSSGLNGRSTEWGIAFDVIARRPVTGQGAATFRDYSEAAIGISRVAHNTFLGVTADLGLVGLILFVGMFVWAGRAVGRFDKDLRRAWLAMLVVWLIGASTLTWEQQKFTFFVLIVLAAQSALRSATGAGAARSDSAESTPLATRATERHW